MSGKKNFTFIEPFVKPKYFILMGWGITLTWELSLKLAKKLGVKIVKEYDIDSYDVLIRIGREKPALDWIYDDRIEKDGDDISVSVFIGYESKIYPDFTKKEFAKEEITKEKMFINKVLGELFGYDKMEIIIGVINREDSHEEKSGFCNQ